MLEELCYPFDGDAVLKDRRKLLRRLKEQPGAVTLRIAVLGGSTTDLIVKMLELFLRNRGIVPAFWESEYNQYLQDAMFPNPSLEAFQPEVIFIHTTARNLLNMPGVQDSRELCEHKLEQAYRQFADMWERLAQVYGCPIIQNNFELPLTRLLGNREAGCPQILRLCGFAQAFLYSRHSVSFGLLRAGQVARTVLLASVQICISSPGNSGICL